MHGGLASKLELSSTPMKATRPMYASRTRCLIPCFLFEIRLRTKMYFKECFAHNDWTENFCENALNQSHVAREFRVSSRGA